MSVMTFSLKGFGRLRALAMVIVMLIAVCAPAAVFAQQPEPAAAEGQAETAHTGGEVNIVLPDLSLTDVGGYDGRALLMGGLVVSFLGVVFGWVILTQLKRLP